MFNQLTHITNIYVNH